MNKNVKALDVRIKELVLELEKHDKGTARYVQLLDSINKLVEARKGLMPVETPGAKLNINTIVTSVFGVIGIMLVTNYEKADIITSKAFNMASRMIGK